jgi:phage repressor protein C with HTH and peptisase S24 domain
VDARDAAQALLNSPKELRAISGLTGPAVARVPGTDAFTGAAKLENLQTRSFVSEIQKMRAASPTGGAVGSVTEKEMSALSNIQASLKAGLKETELRKQLQQYINSANRALKTIPNEYARTYGYQGEFDDILKGGVVQQQPSGLPSGVTVKRK